MERSFKKMALDTNVLLTVLETRQNAIEELRNRFGKKLELVVPIQVLNELKSLANQNAKMKKNVLIAGEILRTSGVKEKKVDAKDADEALEKLAGEGFVVVTNDRELAKKIRQKSGACLRLNRGRLAVDI